MPRDLGAAEAGEPVTGPPRSATRCMITSRPARHLPRLGLALAPGLSREGRLWGVTIAVPVIAAAGTYLGAFLNTSRWRGGRINSSALHHAPVPRCVRRQGQEPWANVRAAAGRLWSSVRCTTWRPCSTRRCRGRPGRHRGPAGRGEARCRTGSTGLPPAAGAGRAAWPPVARPAPGEDWPEAVQVPFPGMWPACQLSYWTCRGSS